MDFYRQCVLEKKNVRTVTWLPESFAKKGKIVKLRKKRENDKWSDGWTVILTGKTRLSHNQVSLLETQWLHQRESSDI